MKCPFHQITRKNLEERLDVSFRRVRSKKIVIKKSYRYESFFDTFNHKICAYHLRVISIFRSQREVLPTIILQQPCKKESSIPFYTHDQTILTRLTSSVVDEESRGWGGVPSFIFPTGMCVPFFRVSFSLFLLNRVSKEGKFSGAGCQNMSKEEILLQRVII